MSTRVSIQPKSVTRFADLKIGDWFKWTGESNILLKIGTNEYIRMVDSYRPTPVDSSRSVILINRVTITYE